MRDMHDRTISVTTAVAIFLWMLGGTFILLAWTEHPPPGVDREPFGSTGLFLALFATTLSMRSFIVHHENSMKELQRNWFELGRDSTKPPLRAVNDR